MLGWYLVSANMADKGKTDRFFDFKEMCQSRITIFVG